MSIIQDENSALLEEVRNLRGTLSIDEGHELATAILALALEVREFKAVMRETLLDTADILRHAIVGVAQAV